MICPACQQPMITGGNCVFYHMCSPQHLFMTIFAQQYNEVYTYALPFLYHNQIHYLESDCDKTIIYNQTQKYKARDCPVLRINNFLPFKDNYQTKAAKLLNLKAFS